MRFPSIVMLCALVVPSPGAAQAPATVASIDVTINVPVDLSQLSPDITKTRVDCTVRSDAITNGNQFKEITQSKEYPVTGGALKTTASIVISLTNLADPVGKNAYAGCSIWGWSQSLSKWGQFHPANTDAVFRTNVTVGLVQTNFVW